jgi:DNA-binding transcriptional LysR family regulator
MEAAVELREFDLNLLVVFQLLLEERRVSAVAARLGLSQPAVSSALKRLRRLLGDELFFRTAQGMEPTPFAERLAGPVAEALGTIHQALQARASFDPDSSTRRFTIAMTDIGEIYFLPELLPLLRRIAPGVEISTVRDTAINLAAEMAAGAVDLAIGYVPHLRAGFFQRRLFPQPYVCMFRPGHRLDRPRLRLADYIAAEHVMVIAAGTGHGEINEQLERTGARPKVRLRVPHFVAVGEILQATDLVASVPEKLAIRMAATYGLKYVTLPVKLPPIEIKLVWHAKFHREPGNQWLRTLVFDTFAE